MLHLDSEAAVVAELLRAVKHPIFPPKGFPLSQIFNGFTCKKLVPSTSTNYPCDDCILTVNGNCILSTVHPLHFQFVAQYFPEYLI